MPLIAANALKPLLPPMGRLIGLDPGSKAIGVAVSDATRLIASPLTTVARPTLNAALEALSRLVTVEEACGVVIGYPVNMDGTEGPRCQSVRAFAKQLDKALNGPPLVLWDERLSTIAAHRGMKEAGLTVQKREESIDKLAAAHMLQGLLDYLRNRT